MRGLRGVRRFVLWGVLSASVVVATGTETPEGLFQTLSAGGWTDDKIVQLASAVSAAGSAGRDSRLIQDAIRNPMFPEEGRPTAFFDALATYFDENRDGHFTADELDKVADTYAARYTDVLRESLAKGPSQSLSAGYRTKTWKMLQKILLLKKTLKDRAVVEWRYQPFSPQRPSETWDQEHTLADGADFKRRVCEASAKAPVVVKFGSTQCADCTLMEFTQGVRLAAEKNKDKAGLYKFWWGPNLPPENDGLRKAEGVKSSPTFAVYRDGKRYTCGFAFLDESGAGLDACLSAALKEDAAASGTCGTSKS
jgi:hypothetical protein